MIPAFFSSARMILLECHESPATLDPFLAKWKGFPFFESNFSVLSTGKKHFARIMQELQFSFLFTPSHTAAGLGENRQLVTDEPVEFEK
jgi:hypothetical protein